MNKHLTIILSVAVMAMSLGLAACEEEAAEAETPAAESPPEEPAATEEAVAEAPAEAPAAEEAADEGAAGGSACERAQSCCEAYVAEMTGGDTPMPGVSVEQTCGNIEQLAASPAGASSCEQMISGWRTGLETAQRSVPAACAAN